MFNRVNLWIAVVGAAMVASLVGAGSASAGKFNKVLGVGDAAPDFKDLVGTDDKPHSLAEWKDAKLVVVVFTCNHCPIAGAYEERILSLARRFEPKGVQFVAVSSSRMKADGPAEMKKRAAEKEYPFPYLHDATQQVGRSYGASATPEVFVLDAARKIAYLGTIDDNWSDETSVGRAYLRDAIEALVEGREPPRVETRPVGCAIQYED
jgi:peroxiredoxin